MASGPTTLLEIDGETVETVVDFIFLAPKSLQIVIAAMKLKDIYSLEEKLWARGHKESDMTERLSTAQHKVYWKLDSKRGAVKESQNKD